MARMWMEEQAGDERERHGMIKWIKFSSLAMSQVQITEENVWMWMKKEVYAKIELFGGPSYLPTPAEKRRDCYWVS